MTQERGKEALSKLFLCLPKCQHIHQMLLCGDRVCATSLRNSSVESFRQILLSEKDISCRNMRNLEQLEAAALQASAGYLTLRLLGLKRQESFTKGWWGGRMQGFCSLNVYKPQDCVAKTPQRESVLDFHEEKVFQMKMCYKHRVTVFAHYSQG